MLMARCGVKFVSRKPMQQETDFSSLVGDGNTTDIEFSQDEAFSDKNTYSKYTFFGSNKYM
jgi:hypothetical protein